VHIVILLDVTLRDGGFVNNFALDFDEVLRIIALLDTCDVDAIEIGYLTGLPRDHGHYPDPGPCYALPIELIAKAAAATTTPLVGMLHLGGRESLDLDALAAAGLALVRVPVTPGTATQPAWIAMVDRLTAARLQFSVNFTLATWASTDDVVACARLAERAGASVFYVVDTNSAFLPHQIETLFARLINTVDTPLGYHAHDNKRLALTNVVAAARGGAQWLDASLAGFGRGQGNAATEVVHELVDKDPQARKRLLCALPSVARDFGVDCSEQLWRQLCAFLDVYPPTVELITRIAEELHTDRYELIAEQMLEFHLPQPPTEDDVRKLLVRWKTG
jgi:4-hydroxy 2-oxovalerate aldolase